MPKHNETVSPRKLRPLLERGLDALSRAKKEIAQTEHTIGMLLYDIEKSEKTKE